MLSHCRLALKSVTVCCPLHFLIILNMSHRKTALALAFSAAVLLSHPSDADAIFGFGNKDKAVLSADDLASQEVAGQKMISNIRAREGSLSSRKQRGMYKDVVKNYPRTESAGEAQFKIGELRENDGDLKKAFQEYQTFITEHPKNPRFGEAVKRQYEIAKALMESPKKGFLGIGAAIQPSKLIEMFEQISSNAPFSEYAPLSMFNIGLVNRTQNNFDAAIDAFDAVVEEYPNSHLHSKAMLQKFEMLGSVAENSNNPQNVRAQREAGQDALNQLSGEQAAEIRAEMGKLEDKQNEKDFNIARFYEKQGNLKSAVVYYREVTSRPSTSEYYPLAKERLDQLLAADPSLAVAPPRRAAPAPAPAADDLPTPNTTASQPAPAAPSAPSVKDRADYLGPPVPAVPNSKPAMRTSADDVVPIP